MLNPRTPGLLAVDVILNSAGRIRPKHRDCCLDEMRYIINSVYVSKTSAYSLGLPTMVNNIRPQQGPRHEIPELARFITIDWCNCRTPDPKHTPAIEGSSEGNRFIIDSSNGNGPCSHLRCNLILDMLFHVVHWLLGRAFS